MGEPEPYAHPQVAFFTVAFKAAALAFYIIGFLLIHNFAVEFVVCIVFISFDFWVVKNVSGRILVGLRWWNETDEHGETHWHFESLDQDALDQLSKRDSWLFWWTLYACPIAWLVLGIVALIRLEFDYILIVAVGVVLGGANLYGYMKCRRDAKNQIQQFANQTMAKHVASTLTSAFAV